MIWPFRRSTGRNAQTGLVLDRDRGGAVATVSHQGGRLRLRHWASCEAPPGGDWRDELMRLLGERREPVNAVIAANAYQLLLVDRPDVPDPEVAAAVRWRIRDRLNTPIDDSVVDTFDVPAQARGNRTMVYAVASRTGVVNELATQVRDAGAPLHTIDIAELCMRNIAINLDKDKFGVAFLLVQGHQGVLTLTRDRKLYLIRQMEIPVGADSAVPADDAVAAIALELQRSLDYFESHYDQRPIREVVLAPSGDGGALAASLGRELAVNVTLLDLNELLETETPLTPQEQAHCLLAVGAALRQPDAMERAA